MDKDSGDDTPGTRTCTDSKWILNLILLWTVVAVIACCSLGVIPSKFIQAGDPLRLYGAMDYRGNFCGRDDPVTELPYVWYPNEFGTTYGNSLLLVPQNLGFCVNTCPSFNEQRTDPYGLLGSWDSPEETVHVAGVCVDAHVGRMAEEDVWRSIWTDIDMVWSDILIGATVVPLSAVFVALVVYVIMFGNTTTSLKGMVKGALWTVSVILMGVGVLFVVDSYNSSLTQSNTNPNVTYSNTEIPKSGVEMELQRGSGVLMIFGCFLWVSLMLSVSSQKIDMALDLLYNGVLLIGEQPLLLIPPCIGLYFLIELTYYAYFFGTHIASSSEVTDAEFANTTTNPVSIVSYKYIHYNKHTAPYLTVLLVLYFWSAWIVSAFTQMVMSNLVWTWYSRLVDRKRRHTATSDDDEEFSHSHISTTVTGQDTTPLLTFSDLWRSYWTILNNHIGTAARGGFISHVCIPVRFIMRPVVHMNSYYQYFLYIYTNRQELNMSMCAKFLSSSAWELISKLVCLCDCYQPKQLLKNIHHFNTNGYVICALKGHNYSIASLHADKLLSTFMKKGGVALQNLQTVLFILSVSICLKCAALAYFYMYYTEIQILHEFIAIPWITAIISYYVINLWFQSMYIMLCTLMIAYIIDEQVDYGKGADKLPLLHLIFIEAYNDRYDESQHDENEMVLRPSGNKGNAKLKKQASFHPKSPIGHHPHDTFDDDSNYSSHSVSNHILGQTPEEQEKKHTLVHNIEHAYASRFGWLQLFVYEDQDDLCLPDEEEEAVNIAILNEYIGGGAANMFVYAHVNDVENPLRGISGSQHSDGDNDSNINSVGAFSVDLGEGDEEFSFLDGNRDKTIAEHVEMTKLPSFPQTPGSAGSNRQSSGARKSMTVDTRFGSNDSYSSSGGKRGDRDTPGSTRAGGMLRQSSVLMVSTEGGGVTPLAASGPTSLATDSTNNKRDGMKKQKSLAMI